MLGESVLNQHKRFLILQDIPREISHILGEQECVSQIRSCKTMKEFKQFHCQILKSGFFSSSFCASNLLASCALSEWGSMDYAVSIFRQIDDPCLFDFNAVIRGYTKDIQSEEAIWTYVEMLDLGINPNNFTFPFLLKACSQMSAIMEGIQIHGQAIKQGIVDDVYVQNSLINLYGKCGFISNSLAIFERMDSKTVASWGALIAAHASVNSWMDCLTHFREMNSEGNSRADESILVSVLSACSHLGSLDYGRSIHGYILRNLDESNIAVQTMLIDMYMKCGSLEKGMALFQEMPTKNLKSYSVVISGLAMHSHWEQALKLFDEMLQRGFNPDEVIYVGVLKSCSNGGLVEKGRQYFDRMRIEHGIEPTIQHYGCMVDLLGQAGLIQEATDLIRLMPMEPTEPIWRSLLNSCSVHKNVELGELAAKKVFQMSSKTSGDYLILCRIYAQAQRWQDVARTRTEMVRVGVHQEPGWSSIEVKQKVHRFVSNDESHHQSHEIYEMLNQMEWQLRFEGYSPDTSQVFLDVNEEEKKQRLSSHSLKLALAFSLIQTENGAPIRITRNVRMCSDCHTYTKLISMIYKREITVKDRNAYHCFRKGTCSCKQ